ncbi:hypothetical protein DUNSADRAFT_7119 [Dunaliella salina]|uniref:LAGLIDADG homing endonuclease n=1 Tax=Dunaliella salina TaxID=3046 RepID=A0ABQ7FTP4_DUNSA|nr:hypothetical protein DUNSADRAFT_7119 [Dunaliella salina]KAF5825767.1 hypothetical protein DUNSADRAFT_7119 [Dunaliella salina]|eukprot:KAF5825766.1 hypothetical protein DUNSADRAFT_7119 [Dunaliella salina]
MAVNGIPSHELNSVWAAIKREVASGGLGTYAKVHGGQRDKVICVYTANLLDKEDVSCVRAKLWDMGHRKKLSYKTDAYTLCGIYWGTRKDLSPTKYSSSSRDTLQDV